MKTNYMMTAEDVATELGISKGHAYKRFVSLMKNWKIRDSSW